MFGLELGGSDGWAWASAKTISFFVASGAFLIAFFFVERAVKDPIIKLELVQRQSRSRAAWASACCTAAS